MIQIEFSWILYCFLEKYFSSYMSEELWYKYEMGEKDQGQAVDYGGIKLL